MDNLGDWLYLLLIIGFAFSGFFKGPKKQKPTNTPINIPEKNTGSNAHRIDTDPKNIKKIKTSLKKEQTLSPQVSQTSQSLPHTKTSGKSVQSAPKASPENGRKNTPTLQPDIRNNEELRRAFIFSEILKRKY